jgi:hypothetical protein
MSNYGNGYNGNPLLKKSGVQIEWTPEMMEEWVKCAKDPIYFSEKYIKIVHVDRGFIPIELYDYQKEIITGIHTHRNVSVATSRQAGKCFCINTPVRLRNKTTGEIMEMTIGDFYKQAKSSSENDDNEA